MKVSEYSSWKHYRQKQERFLHLAPINPNECYPQNTLYIRNKNIFFPNKKIMKQNFSELCIEIYVAQN